MSKSIRESFLEARVSTGKALHNHRGMNPLAKCINAHRKGQCDSFVCPVYTQATDHLFKLVYYTMRLFLAQLWKWELEWDPNFDDCEHKVWWKKMIIAQLYQHRLWTGPGDELVDCANFDMFELAFQELASLDGTNLSLLLDNHRYLWNNLTESRVSNAAIPPIEADIEKQHETWINGLHIMSRPETARISRVQHIAKVMSMESFFKAVLRKPRNCVLGWKKALMQDGTIHIYAIKHRTKPLNPVESEDELGPILMQQCINQLKK